mmetsp:Transcript_105/g.357  ORF Transcript_105/g.357 Transcript_105/m.357 type:complete len:214 (-) Transcript_105:884-1525(-)
MSLLGGLLALGFALSSLLGRLLRISLEDRSTGRDGETANLVHAGALEKSRINEDERCHGLNEGRGAGKHTRVMASLGLEHSTVTLEVHSVLGTTNCTHSLDCDAEDNVSATGDTSQGTSSVVGLGTNNLGSINLLKGIIVSRSLHLGTGKSGSHLKSLSGRQREHAVSKESLQLIKTRLSKSHRHVGAHAGHGTSDRVILRLDLADQRSHAAR